MHENGTENRINMMAKLKCNMHCSKKDIIHVSNPF